MVQLALPLAMGNEPSDGIDGWISEISRCQQLLLDEVFNIALAYTGIDGLRQPGS